MPAGTLRDKIVQEAIRMALEPIYEAEFTATAGTIDLPELTTLENGRLDVSGGSTFSVPKLSNIDGASILVSGGVTQALPSVTGYSANNVRPELRASGTDTVLKLNQAQSLLKESDAPGLHPSRWALANLTRVPSKYL